MIPILALAAWVFQPHVAEQATPNGWIVSDEGPASAPAAPSDD